MSDAFRIQLEHAQNGGLAGQPQAARAASAAHSPAFAETLAQVQEVRFSNHAQKRLQSRDIALSDEHVNRLSQAIHKAEQRGGKSSLVMVDDLAFVVNVRERLVVTAVDAGHRGEGVFTQIDSVVIAEPVRSAPVSLDKKG
ncbi:MAG: TIGR02530 family flagellar biosynthesis protein [Chloroflexota bacterium]